MRRIYSRRGAAGKLHHPEGWICSECGQVRLDDKEEQVIQSKLFNDTTNITIRGVKPFLKWAGGKGQLLKQFEKYYPEKLVAGGVKKYFEPFVGSGAVFFNIIQSFNVDEYYISDVNEELILVYISIKENVEELIKLLKVIETKYLLLSEEEREELFYDTRDKFNKAKSEFDFDNYNDTWLERAAQTIFLNRTCFNGLFRVNSKGGFNVPFGRYVNPTICNEKNLRKVSTTLADINILKGDFTISKDLVDDTSFVYFDPPYRPVSKTSSFTSYSTDRFLDSEQMRLAEYYKELHNKGAMLMLSNSDPKNNSPSDNFFDDIYSDFNIKKVKAKRAINTKADGRGKIFELVILNYQIRESARL